MNYTLHQLSVFLKITETKSITKAAELLNLTQPAVSIQLKNFQDQFEIPLTEVVGRRLYVTEFGKEIAEAAQKISNEVQEIQFKTMAFKGLLTGTLKVAIVSTGKYIMPYFLTDFINKNKGIELVLDVTNKTKVLKDLEKNEIDFALVSVLPENLNISSEEFMPNRLYLVANRAYECVKKKNDLSILTEMPFIYREEGSGTRWSIERFFEKNQLNIKKKLELTSNEAVKQAILSGLGVSIMPLIGIKNELLKGDLKIIPVKGLPISTQWNLIWPKQKSMSPVAKAYLEYIKNNKSSIIKEKFDWYENL